MSTLEKAMELLQEMPECKLEAVYMYMCYVNSQTNDKDTSMNEAAETHITENSVEKRRKAFQSLLSFAGTLPEDFDYKQELKKARETKYARFT